MIFHYVAVVIDLWLRLRSVFCGTWRALPGDAMGQLIVFGCGIPPGLSRQYVGADGTRAVLVEDRRAGRYLDRQLMPVRAQTLGRYVLAREPLPREIVEHELEHVRQWERWGPLFLAAYFASSAWAVLRGDDAYRANAFERAAEQAAARAAVQAGSGRR